MKFCAQCQTASPDSVLQCPACASVLFEAPPPVETDGFSPHAEPGVLSWDFKWVPYRFFVALLQSYLFWVIALPLLNPDLIWIAIFPFLAIAVLDKFLPFLAPPFFIALATLGATAFFVWRNHTTYEWWLPLSANAVFLIAFLVSADAYKSILIHADALPYEPECIHVHSFLRSVREAGEFSPEHANFVKNGVTYFWSYSERKFVLGSTGQERGCPQP